MFLDNVWSSDSFSCQDKTEQNPQHKSSSDTGLPSEYGTLFPDGRELILDFGLSEYIFFQY